MDQYVPVSDRELEAVKHATGKRSARTAVRAALRFTAKYCGRPAYTLGLDLDTPHPDTLKSVENHKADRTRSFASAKECFATLRAEIAAKPRKTGA